MKAKDRSFEDALTRLEIVVKKLEDGQLPLEEALQLFGEGVELANACNGQLAEAEQRISMLASKPSGEIMLKELTVELNAEGQD